MSLISPTLERLAITNVKSSEAISSILSVIAQKSSGLRTFLVGGAIAWEHLAPLFQLKNLRHVSIQSHATAHDPVLLANLLCLPSLHRLSMSARGGLVVEAESLEPGMAQLDSLKLDGSLPDLAWLIGLVLQPSVMSVKSLRIILCSEPSDLPNPKDLRDFFSKHIAPFKDSLVSLSFAQSSLGFSNASPIDWCTGFTLIEPLLDLRRLEHLCLALPHLHAGLGDVDAPSLAAAWPLVKILRLPSGCGSPHMTAKSLAWFARCCPHLTTLQADIVMTGEPYPKLSLPKHGLRELTLGKHSTLGNVLNVACHLDKLFPTLQAVKFESSEMSAKVMNRILCALQSARADERARFSSGCLVAA